MTYDVAVKLKPQDVLLDIFDWLENNNLYFSADWDFTRPDYFKGDWNHTFKFKRSEDATLFALRWA